MDSILYLLHKIRHICRLVKCYVDKSVPTSYEETTMKSTIGERVREARENKDFDQATLAEKVGIVTRTLQRWEKGEQIPDGISITKIAKATNVHPHWLLT